MAGKRRYQNKDARKRGTDRPLGVKRRAGRSLSAAAALIILLAAGYLKLEDLHIPTDWNRPKISATVPAGEMQVTFLDVGQGDCTVVQTEGHAAVIDTGNNDQGEKVVSYLESEGIDTLDYLILTHPDADHIGGGDNVLEGLEVKKVIMPDVENDTKTYDEVAEDIDTYRVEVVHPQEGDTFPLGDAEFTVLCPEEELESAGDMNGSSVGIKLVHGENSFVMCGDAEERSEEAMVERFGSELECDVLKCGHHGSSTATTDEFLEKTDPVWAVISCGEDNSYGHPHAEVLDKLERADTQVYRTDRQGTIVAVSDGSKITWECEK